MVAGHELAPIAQLDNDHIRQQIDAALGKALKLPNLGALRELLAREPGLSARDIARPRTIELDESDTGAQTDSEEFILRG